MAKKRTINLMISEEADARLRSLSAELKQAMGAIIEQAIMQWKPGTATPVESTPITDSIEARFNALEIRLQAIEVVGAVRVGAVGNECQGAAVVPVGVVPEPVANVGVEPAIDQGVTQKADMPTGATPESADAAEKKKSLTNDELDVIVRDYLKRSGDKIISAGDLMRKDGISFSQKRLIESRDRVVAADNIKKLWER